MLGSFDETMGLGSAASLDVSTMCAIGRGQWGKAKPCTVQAMFRTRIALGSFLAKTLIGDYLKGGALVRFIEAVQDPSRIRWRFGSVAESVLRHCPRPLLVRRAAAAD